MFLNAVELFLFTVALVVAAGFAAWQVRRLLDRGGWPIRCDQCARNLRWAIRRHETVCPYCGAPIGYNPKTQSSEKEEEGNDE